MYQQKVEQVEGLQYLPTLMLLGNVMNIETFSFEIPHSRAQFKWICFAGT